MGMSGRRETRSGSKSLHVTQHARVRAHSTAGDAGVQVERCFMRRGYILVWVWEQGHGANRRILACSRCTQQYHHRAVKAHNILPR